MRSLVGLLAVCLTAPLFAQDDRDLVPDSWNVVFASRSFDLEEYRTAIAQRRPAAEIDAIVADLEARMRADQAPFVRAVEALGGRVERQWWIINGANVALAKERVAALQSLPNVARVDQDRVVRPALRVATDANHHDTDAANLMLDRDQRPVRGAGIGIAVLDSGADADMGGSGRPHASYYRGGDPNDRGGGGLLGSRLTGNFGVSGEGTEDINGHGTFVAGCATGSDWQPGWTQTDDAPAPDAWTVNVKISQGSAGNSTTALMASGWQKVAAERARLNLGVGNNSFTGSPSLNDVGQMALDSVAFSADVAICCAAGNDPTSTQSSQSAYNGLAVGSVAKTSLQVSSFSARGPLFGTQRSYPDVVGVGENVVTTLMDTESNYAIATGTSLASPLVAGQLALIRQAGESVDPRLDARCAKALLLNTTTASSDRNAYGLGFAKAPAAVDAALRGDYVRGVVSRAAPVWTFDYPITPGTWSATLVWMRAGGAATPANLDLTILDGSGQAVATDGNPENSYEKVTYTVTAAATYRVEVRLVSPGSHQQVAFCVAGVGQPALPTLVSLSRATVDSYRPGKLRLTGSELLRTARVSIGGQQMLDFTPLSQTQLEVVLPDPMRIGTHPVTVCNATGVSNALSLQVDGMHPPLLIGETAWFRGVPTSYRIFTDAGWESVVFVSTSSVPSHAMGLLSLGIGNNFSELWQVAVLLADDRGHAALPLRAPLLLPSIQLYFQTTSLDPAAPTPPLETSNVLPTYFF